jgi:hypothetical protein
MTIFFINTPFAYPRQGIIGKPNFTPRCLLERLTFSLRMEILCTTNNVSTRSIFWGEAPKGYLNPLGAFNVASSGIPSPWISPKG